MPVKSWLGLEDHLRTDAYVEWDIKLKVLLDGLTLSPKMLAQLFRLQFIVQMSFHSGLIKGCTFLAHSICVVLLL